MTAFDTPLELWLEMKQAEESSAAIRDVLAKPLEDCAASLDNGYAKLVGLDSHGNVVFAVRGLGRQTFSLEELEQERTKL